MGAAKAAEGAKRACNDSGDFAVETTDLNSFLRGKRPYSISRYVVWVDLEFSLQQVDELHQDIAPAEMRTNVLLNLQRRSGKLPACQPKLQYEYFRRRTPLKRLGAYPCSRSSRLHGHSWGRDLHNRLLL
jgi:hypothetical protein